MKPTLILAALLLSANAMAAAPHAANHGHHAGPANGQFGHATSSASTSAAQSGNGGRASLVDDYQPWPQAEMAQFAKPTFTPYDGK